MTFIAALDQSGGSTPGALERYGVTEYTDMMEEVHNMRLRIVNSPSFTREHIDTAILFEDTVDRGMVDVLKAKGINAYLKVDAGLANDGTMRQFPLKDRIAKALDAGCTGTKMRSVINPTHSEYMDVPNIVRRVVGQQFATAQTIAEAGLMPIVEPEVDIHHMDKQAIEMILRDQLEEYLLRHNCIKVTLKLTIPEIPNLYKSLLDIPSCHRIVALSGGYSTSEACERLTKQQGMGASFSRALLEGLTVDLTEAEFDAKLASNIEKISRVSV